MGGAIEPPSGREVDFAKQKTEGECGNFGIPSRNGTSAFLSCRRLPSFIFSLRLGHARVLTPPRGVIHCARAASLPLGGGAKLQPHELAPPPIVRYNPFINGRIWNPPLRGIIFRAEPLSLPPRGRWILRSKRRKENAARKNSTRPIAKCNFNFALSPPRAASGTPLLPEEGEATTTRIGFPAPTGSYIVRWEIKA